MVKRTQVNLNQTGIRVLNSAFQNNSANEATVFVAVEERGATRGNLRITKGNDSITLPASCTIEVVL